MSITSTTAGVRITLPLSSTGPTWSTMGAAVANPITYAVRLKAWIYRL